MSDPNEEPPAEPLDTLVKRLHEESIAGYLKAKCYRCHSDAKAAANLNLQRLKPDFSTPDSLETWHRVYERMRDEEMPPGAKQARAEAEAAAVPADDGPPVPGFPFPGRRFLRPRDPDPAEGTIVALRKLLSAADKVKAEADLDRKPIVNGEKVDSLRSLQIQRRNAAAVVADVYQSQYELGTVTMDLVLEAFQNLANAELALASTPEQRILLYRRQLHLARQAEEISLAMFRGGRVDEVKYYSTKVARLSAQIQLQQALDARKK